MEPENNETNVDGEWSSVGKGGKGSKKQKKKNRTIPWQTFMSQGDGGGVSQSPDGFGSSGESLCRDDSLRNVPVDLSEEDLVVKASLITFFTDLLRRLGPVKRDDPRIKSEFDGISDQGQLLVKRHGNLQDFLVLDDSIAVIDDFICLQSDIEAARSLALAQVMEKAAVLSANNKKDHISTDDVKQNGVDIITSTIASQLNYTKTNFTNSFSKTLSSSNKSSNVWNTSAKTSSPSNGIDPWLQLPEVESLFDINKTIQPPAKAKTSIVTIPSSFPIPPPPLSTDPPPPSLIKPPIVNGYSSVVAAGTVNDQNEALNKRLKGLTDCNADLLKQVAEKDKVIQALSNLVPDQRDANRAERLENELREAREELLQVKNDNEELKKQLDKEIIRSRKFQHDFEKERSASAKLLERYNAIIKSSAGIVQPTLSPSSLYLPVNVNLAQPASVALSPNRTMAPGMPSVSGAMGNSVDSLGLRSIWNNASSRTTERPGQYSTSAGSVFLQKQGTPYQPNIMAQASQLSNIFGSSVFELGHGVFSPLATSAITTTTTSSNSSSSTSSSSLYGNHKCL